MPTFEGEIEIPFEPTERDVVSTKLRNWTLQHKGNLDYADVLTEFAQQLPSPSHPDHTVLLKQSSERIVDIVTDDRDGRFLKLMEGDPRPAVCILMTKRGALHKVMNGLKNKQITLLKRDGKKPFAPIRLALPKPIATLMKAHAANFATNSHNPTTTTTTRPKGMVHKKAVTTTFATTTTPAPRPKRRKLNTGGSVASSSQATNHSNSNATATVAKPMVPTIQTSYEATLGEEMGSSNIHRYALELVSHVCNHTNTNNHSNSSCSNATTSNNSNGTHQNQRNAISSIDKPLSSRYSSPEEEPDKERMIRIQLRHRFYSAAAIQMPVVTFARKLVEEIWGGNLVAEEEIVMKRQPTTTMATPTTTTARAQKRQAQKQPRNANANHQTLEYSAEQYVHPASSTATTDHEDHRRHNHRKMENSSDTEEEDEHSNHGGQHQEVDSPYIPAGGSGSGGGGSTHSYFQRREYFHEDPGSSGRKRRASQKFMDAMEDEEEVMGHYQQQQQYQHRVEQEEEEEGEEVYRWGGNEIDSEEFYDARESVQDSMPSLRTAASSISKPKGKPVYGKKRRQKKKTAVAKPNNRGNRAGCYTFEDRKVQLQEYKDIHGGELRVPTAKNGVYYNLGAWLAAQKSLYKKGTLKKERLDDLRALGCVGFGGPAGN